MQVSRQGKARRVMTVDIRFGTLQWEDGDYECTWGGNEDPLENDGTSSEYTIFSGMPLRSFSNRGYWEWTRSSAEVNALHHAMKPVYPNSNDSEWVKVIDVIHLIERLPIQSGCDADRVAWFKYWARRAINEFGNAAVICIW